MSELKGVRWRKLRKYLDEWWRRVQPGIRTAFPGFVTSYDHGARTATVQQSRRVAYTDGRPTVDAAPLRGAPVVQVTRGGGFVIAHALQADDAVLVLCMDRPIDEWRKKGGIVEPGATGFHRASDGVVITGLSPDNKPITLGAEDELYVGTEDGKAQIRVKRSGTVVIEVAETVELGGEGGPEVARKGDKSKASDLLSAWATKVETAINTLAPGTFPDPFATTTASDVARIDEGSSKVKAVD